MNNWTSQTFEIFPRPCKDDFAVVSRCPLIYFEHPLPLRRNAILLRRNALCLCNAFAMPLHRGAGVMGFRGLDKNKLVVKSFSILAILPFSIFRKK